MASSAGCDNILPPPLPVPEQQAETTSSVASVAAASAASTSFSLTKSSDRLGLGTPLTTAKAATAITIPIRKGFLYEDDEKLEKATKNGRAGWD